MAWGITSFRGKFVSGLFIGGIQNKVPIDGVHVPIERRPVIIRLDSGKIYLDELRQNGRGFFLVDKADCTGEQFGSRRLSSLKWERSFFGAFHVAQHGDKIRGLHIRQTGGDIAGVLVHELRTKIFRALVGGGIVATYEIVFRQRGLSVR